MSRVHRYIPTNDSARHKHQTCDEHQRTGKVDHGLVSGHGPLLHKQLVEVLAARGEHRLVRTMLLPLDQQRDVTELVVETLRVQLVQHGLAVSGEELVHLALTVNLQDVDTLKRTEGGYKININSSHTETRNFLKHTDRSPQHTHR